MTFSAFVCFLTSCHIDLDQRISNAGEWRFIHAVVPLRLVRPSAMGSPRLTRRCVSSTCHSLAGISRRYQFHVRGWTMVRHRPPLHVCLCLSLEDIHHRSQCFAGSKRSSCLPRKSRRWRAERRAYMTWYVHLLFLYDLTDFF